MVLNDLLHDEGQAYTERITSAGVTVCTKLHPDQIHGFVATQPSDAHPQAVNDISQWLTDNWTHNAT
tara:strand:+ start:115360 stop:115560 length:201 start_codon:yes stop_codon:yes gene_type:complete